MIDRELRRKAADHLAAFMRGEMTNMDYLERAKDFGHHAEIDRNDTVVANAIWTFWWDDPKAAEHTIAVKPERWGEMERTLAFLESNLVERRVVQANPSVWMRTRDVALVLTACVLLFCVARLWLSSFWLFVTVWLGIGGVGALVGGLKAWWRSSKRAPKSKFAPFRDEAQWHAHQHLLHRFALPPYDPAVHGRMPSRPRLSAGEWTKQIALFIAVMPILVVSAAISAPFGAFFLAFGPPDYSESTVVTDDGDS